MKLLEYLADRVAPAQGSARVGDSLTRRAVLSPAALAAAFWGTEAMAGAPTGGERSIGGTVPWLVHRITMGLTQTDLDHANLIGYSAYLEEQLNYTALDDTALNNRLTQYTTLTMEPYQLYPPPPTQPLPVGQVIGELTEATILRSVLSTRQLYQRMVEFWTDHFNIDITNGFDQWLKTIDDRDVIRPHALGYFRNLLVASAHSPAMLFYLDNTTSVAGNPNENYARELMELHTLSVDGGYTQTDVQEVARCLTGWGMYSPNVGAPNALKFQFLNARHDNNPKTIFAGTPQQINIGAGGGQSDGDIVLDALARHPSTVNFIAKKLCKWFWGENPPQSLIDAVATAYDRNNANIALVGDIQGMIRSIFNSAETASAPLKYKRPYHMFMSALRATASTITSTSNLRSAHLAAAGHVPFMWSPPDGYPDTLDHWVGLILPRWSFGASLVETTFANDFIQGITFDVNAFFSGTTTAEQMADRINTKLFGGEMATAERDRIRDYLLPDAPTVNRKREAVGLAIGAPGYQWY